MTDLYVPKSEIYVPETEVVPPEDGKRIPTMVEIRDIAMWLGRILNDVNNDPLSPVNIDMVVPVFRGGITPSDPVIRMLGTRNSQAMAMEFYKRNPDPNGPPEIPTEKPTIHQAPRLGRKHHLGKGVLFFDDLADKYKTAIWVKEHFPLSLFGTIYIKTEEEEALEHVDIYGLHTGDVWIKNPWEVEDERGYSPARPMESLDWAVNGRPQLEELYEQRKALLYRPELIKRITAKPSMGQRLGGLATGLRHWGLTPRY
ncbi:MAG TPA: hypothetical protein VLF88_00400 [Candidatus Babeliales bacterium]|nr:hypothetical protein [Candidatus Babeliales bacterium]